MNQKIEIIYTKIHELTEFLNGYKDYPNVKYFLNTLNEIEMVSLYYVNQEMPDDIFIDLKHHYKSMFFPRDGLGDFYVNDLDKNIMREKNEYLSKLIKELNTLLR